MVLLDPSTLKFSVINYVVLSAMLAIMVAKAPGPVPVYKNKPFARFARKERIADAELWEAAQRANQGLIDADLGGGVIKQRIARAGEGKSGGSRSIILFRKHDRAIYIHGYEKKDRASIKSNELGGFQALAKAMLSYSLVELAELLEDGELFVVSNVEEEEDAEEISQ